MPLLSRRALPVPLSLAVVAASVVAVTSSRAEAQVRLVHSSVTASDGTTHT